MQLGFTCITFNLLADSFPGQALRFFFSTGKDDPFLAQKKNASGGDEKIKIELALSPLRLLGASLSRDIEWETCLKMYAYTGFTFVFRVLPDLSYSMATGRQLRGPILYEVLVTFSGSSVYLKLPGFL